VVRPRCARALVLLHLAFWSTIGCSGADTRTATGGPAGSRAAPEAPERITIAVLGTSDVHGHIGMLPYLAGSVSNLRASGTVNDVVLVDAGDMFQGTLESNLNEGASVIELFNLLGYAAAAIGNHEFDFGPAGEAVVPSGPDDDPRGALIQRARQARFPLLAANLADQGTGQLVNWPNVQPSVLIERAGVKIGIVGVSTIDTPRTTMARNFAGLAMAPLAGAIAREAGALRQRGAHLVLVASHAGGSCKEFGDPRDLSSCDPEQEIFQVAEALPPGSVDAILAGHTHQAVAHEVNGIAIVQSYAKAVAFSRVDLVLDGERRVVARRIHPPRYLCGERYDPPDFEGGEPCPAGDYEGRPVAQAAEIEQLVARYRDAAHQVKSRKLGVTVEVPVPRAFAAESPLGNLFADLMRAARPDADVALTNGGGLRADLPAGALTYGALYEVMPFDNRFATVRLTGAQLTRLIARNLAGPRGVFLLSGVRVVARCAGGKLVVRLRRDKTGRPVGDRDKLLLVTNDFLASGGDGMLAELDLPAGAVKLHDDGPTIRDAVVEVLKRRRVPLRGDDPRIYDPKAPRLDLPGRRPVRCE
jgi:5'-nucleotidase